MKIKYVSEDMPKYGLELLPKLRIPQSTVFEGKKYTVATVFTEKLRTFSKKVSNFCHILFKFVIFKSSFYELKEAFFGKKIIVYYKNPTPPESPIPLIDDLAGIVLDFLAPEERNEILKNKSPECKKLTSIMDKHNNSLEHFFNQLKDDILVELAKPQYLTIDVDIDRFNKTFVFRKVKEALNEHFGKEFVDLSKNIDGKKKIIIQTCCGCLGFHTHPASHKMLDILKNPEIFKRLYLGFISIWPGLKAEHNHLLRDKEFLLQLVRNKPILVDIISDELRDDEDIMLNSISKNDYSAFLKASVRLRTNDDFVFKAFRKNGLCIGLAPKKYKDMDAFAMEAILENPEAFKSLSVRLRTDEKIVRAAINKKGRVIQYATYDRNTEYMILEAIENDPYTIRCLGPLQEKNRILYLAAAKKDGTVIDYFPFEFKMDEEIVKIALTNNVKALISIPVDFLRTHMNLILQLVGNNPDAIFFVESIVPADSIQHLKTKICNNLELLMNAAQKHSNTLNILQQNGRHNLIDSNKDLVLKAVENFPQSLEHAGIHRDDEEVVLVAFIRDPTSIHWVGDSLKKNEKIKALAEAHGIYFI